MDSLKFAFDTLIIGALALPWLALFMRLFFQSAPPHAHDQQFPMLNSLPEHTRDAVAGVLIVALGYVLGSAVSRISSDFFDDEELFHTLPTQGSILQGVYKHEYCDEHSVLRATKLPGELTKLTGGRAAFCAAPGDSEDMQQIVAEFFRLQEAKLLLSGEEKIGRLREYHDQIEILRGATLNGGILFALFWFGLCALYRSRLPPRDWRRPFTWLPAATCLAYGLWAMWQHFVRNAPNLYESHRDPPLAEMVLILLGAGGFFVRHNDESPSVFRNGCLVAAVLTVLAYGAWWWTEVLYDQQVIHSLPTIGT